MQTDPIKITAPGLDDRSHATLAKALFERSQGHCILVSADEAQIVLIDIDNSHSRQLINQIKENRPDLPIVGICRSANPALTIEQVTKPVNINELVAAFTRALPAKLSGTSNRITQDKIALAMQAIESKNLGKALSRRIDENNTQQATKRGLLKKSDEMCFNPERFLLGTLIEADQQSRVTQKLAVIKCWSDRTILIDPQTRIISTDLNHNQIRNLAIAPMDDALASPTVVEYHVMDSKNTFLDKIFKQHKPEQFAREDFMWNLGVMTCRGRIPLEVAINERQYLRRWPNLTRTIIPENAIRILAYWSKQPCSMDDMKQQLDLPYQDIFTVFSGAFAAGIAGQAKRNADMMLDVYELKPAKQRGILKLIVNRLLTDKQDKHAAGGQG